jgi:hypothetical protein
MKDDRHNASARISQWFESNSWRPLISQKRCWSAHGQGKSGLIVAPTGIGKTYAAWVKKIKSPPEEGPSRAQIQGGRFKRLAKYGACEMGMQVSYRVYSQVPEEGSIR